MNKPAPTHHQKPALQRLLFNAGVLVLCALVLFPLVWMLFVSFMMPGEASSFPPPLLPQHPTLNNYRELFSHAGIAHYFMNSLLLACLATVLSLLFNVSAGYAFAKLKFTGKETIYKMLLAAMVIPAQVAMLPLFLMLKHIGLIPSMAGIFSIFLVRQYATTIPNELIEAARIDGANEFRIFFSIVLPGLTPILISLAIFTFLGSWNDFMWPLIVLTDSDMYTLPLALASLTREHVQDSEMMMAGSVLTIVPVLLLFLGLQRFYVQGLMVGSVK